MKAPTNLLTILSVYATFQILSFWSSTFMQSSWQICSSPLLQCAWVTFLSCRLYNDVCNTLPNQYPVCACINQNDTISPQLWAARLLLPQMCAKNVATSFQTFNIDHPHCFAHLCSWPAWRNAVCHGILQGHGLRNPYRPRELPQRGQPSPKKNLCRPGTHVRLYFVDYLQRNHHIR